MTFLIHVKHLKNIKKFPGAKPRDSLGKPGSPGESLLRRRALFQPGTDSWQGFYPLSPSLSYLSASKNSNSEVLGGRHFIMFIWVANWRLTSFLTGCWGWLALRERQWGIVLAIRLYNGRFLQIWASFLASYFDKNLFKAYWQQTGNSSFCKYLNIGRKKFRWRP